MVILLIFLLILGISFGFVINSTSYFEIVKINGEIVNKSSYVKIFSKNLTNESIIFYIPSINFTKKVLIKENYISFKIPFYESANILFVKFALYNPYILFNSSLNYTIKISSSLLLSKLYLLIPRVSCFLLTKVFYDPNEIENISIVNESSLINISVIPKKKSLYFNLTVKVISKKFCTVPRIEVIGIYETIDLNSSILRFYPILVRIRKNLINLTKYKFYIFIENEGNKTVCLNPKLIIKDVDDRGNPIKTLSKISLNKTCIAPGKNISKTIDFNIQDYAYMNIVGILEPNFEEIINKKKVIKNFVFSDVEVIRVFDYSELNPLVLISPPTINIVEGEETTINLNFAVLKKLFIPSDEYLRVYSENSSILSVEYSPKEFLKKIVEKYNSYTLTLKVKGIKEGVTNIIIESLPRKICFFKIKAFVFKEKIERLETNVVLVRKSVIDLGNGLYEVKIGLKNFGKKDVMLSLSEKLYGKPIYYKGFINLGGYLEAKNIKLSPGEDRVLTYKVKGGVSYEFPQIEGSGIVPKYVVEYKKILKKEEEFKAESIIPIVLLLILIISILLNIYSIRMMKENEKEE